MAIRFVRSINPSIFILVRTRYAAEVDELLKLGADQVIAEEFETSIEIFSRSCTSTMFRATSSRTRSASCASTATRCCAVCRWTRRRSAGSRAVRRGHGGQRAGPARKRQHRRTLKDLDLRRSTGATVIAIVRNGEAITIPASTFAL